MAALAIKIRSLPSPFLLLMTKPLSQKEFSHDKRLCPDIFVSLNFIFSNLTQRKIFTKFISKIIRYTLATAPVTPQVILGASLFLDRLSSL